MPSSKIPSEKAFLGIAPSRKALRRGSNPTPATTRSTGCDKAILRLVILILGLDQTAGQGAVLGSVRRPSRACFHQGGRQPVEQSWMVSACW